MPRLYVRVHCHSAGAQAKCKYIDPSTTSVACAPTSLGMTRGYRNVITVIVVGSEAATSSSNAGINACSIPCQNNLFRERTFNSADFRGSGKSFAISMRFPQGNGIESTGITYE
jgi:hypothetical protein